MTKKVPVRLMLAAVAALLSLAVAPVALAGKPATSGGGKATTNGTIALVLVDSTDGVPHWGQHVRFDVQTTATSEPRVELSCSQGGTLVYRASTGYYPGYPWPWTQTFALESGAWTGGAADCSAVLYKLDNRGRRSNLASLAFHVYA
jgi:hypothetical protein